MGSDLEDPDSDLEDPDSSGEQAPEAPSPGKCRGGGFGPNEAGAEQGTRSGAFPLALSLSDWGDHFPLFTVYF